MSNQIRVIAIIKICDNQEQLFREEVEKLAAVTNLEEGCIQYDFHQNTCNSKMYAFFEIWSSHAEWCNHMRSNHMIDFKKNTEKINMSKDIYEMELIL